MKIRVQKAIQRRRNVLDKFRDVNGYSWDFVMVFRVYRDEDPVSSEQQRFNMRTVLAQISSGGLEIRLSYSVQVYAFFCILSFFILLVQHTVVFCKIRAPLTRLLREADRINYPLPTDPKELEMLCRNGRKDFWGPIITPDKDETGQTSMKPFDFIYLEYHFIPPEEREVLMSTPDGACKVLWLDALQKAYKRWPKDSDSVENSTQTVNPVVGSEFVVTSENLNTMGLLRGVDRMKLIRSILTNSGSGGCHLDIDMLLRKKCIVALFPLHDAVELRSLEIKWLKLLEFPWYQKVDDVKNYFGEKIGLYFLWLGHYTTWLIGASIVGIAFWINIATDSNNPNAPSIPYFAVFMAIWATMFLEYWKRMEKRTALQWGMVGFESAEQARPAFEGTTLISPVDGQPTLYFSRRERSIRSFKSNVAIFGGILIVIGTVAFVFFIRAIISASNLQYSGIQTAVVLSSLLLAVQIQVGL